MPYKVYSDSYLMSLTKKQLIEILRTAEHNFKTIEEALNNSARVGKEYADKFDEAKRLLELAVDDMKEIDFCSQVCCRDSLACRTADFCDFKWRYADEAEKLLKEN